MATVVSEQNTTALAPLEFCAKASALGIFPGDPPATLQTTLGNRLPLLRRNSVQSNGHIMEWHYRQMAGALRLVVLNE